MPEDFPNSESNTHKEQTPDRILPTWPTWTSSKKRRAPGGIEIGSSSTRGRENNPFQSNFAPRIVFSFQQLTGIESMTDISGTH